jgi:hypothetical protein
MLTGKLVGVDNAGVIRAVGLQQGVLGAALDDVRLDVVGVDSRYAIEVEAKTGIHFRASDPDFSETIQRSRDAIRARGATNHDHFYLAVPHSTPNLHIALQLQNNARLKSAQDFETLLTGATSNTQRRVATAFRSVIGSPARIASYAELWGFLQRFTIVPLDFDQSISQSRLTAEALIEYSFQVPSATASQIFDRITRAVESAGPVAGRLEPDDLLALLRGDFESLGDPSHRRLVAERIGQFSRLAASDIKSTIHDVRLDREQVRNEVRSALEVADCVLLHGPSGRGKSAILKAYFDETAVAGPALLLSARRISTLNGWFALARDLNIEPNFQTVAQVLQGNPQGPILYIDGLSEIDSLEAQAVINDVLLGLAEALRGRRNLKVIASTRERGLPAWFRSSGNAPAVVSIPEASDEDLIELGERFAILRPLLARSRSNPILRSLFAIRVIVDERMTSTLSEPRVLSEVDICRAWWDRIVGAGQLGSSKQRALQQIATELLARPTRTFLGDGVDPNALEALRADQIIIKDQRRDIYFVAHDLIQDWALMRILDREPRALLDFLRNQANPPYLWRAVLLIAESAFEDPELREWFFETRSYLSTEPSLSYWRTAFDSAIVESTKADAILRDNHQKLLNDNAELLRALVNTLTSVEVEPNFGLAEAFRKNAPEADAAGVEFLQPLPHWLVWAPILRTLIRLSESMPAVAVPDVCRAFAMWQRTTTGDMPLRLGIAKQAVKWVETLHLGSRRDDPLTGLLCDIVSNSADIAPEPIGELLDRTSTSRLGDFAMALIKEPGRLPAAIPSAFRTFAERMLVDKRRSSRDDDDYFELSHNYGLRGGMSLYPASPVQGPFLALLRADEAEGIALVNALVNLATEVYLESSFRRGGLGRPMPTKVGIGKKAVVLWGDEPVYQWFRPTSTGSDIATSALMALELYGEQQIETGRDPKSLFPAVLKGSRSVAIAGVLISLTLEYPKRCVKAALPLIRAAQLWRMDVPRLVNDQMPSLMNIAYSRHSALRRINDDRNKRPQRALQIANLAGLYVFSADARLARFFQELKDTPIDAAKLWENESLTESAETVETIRAFADKANYKIVDDGVDKYVRFERPPLRQEERYRLDVGVAIQRAITLHMWGFTNAMRETSIEQLDAPAADAALAELLAMRNDEGLRDSQDFSEYSQRAVIDVSAGILALAVRDNTGSSDLAARAFRVIIDEARRLQEVNWRKHGWQDGDALDERCSIAAGLGYARALEFESNDLDRLLLSALEAGLPHVGAAAVRGTASMWQKNLPYASNILRTYLAMALSSVDQTIGGSATAVESFLERVRTEQIDLPPLTGPKRAASLYGLGLALEHISIDDLPQESAAVHLFAKIVRDYIAAASRNPDIAARDHLTQWFQAFAQLIVAVAFKLEADEGGALLMDVAKGSKEWPDLVEAVLYAFTLKRLVFIDIDKLSVERWHDLATYILSLFKKDAASWHDLIKYRDLLGQLMFYSPWSGPMIRAEWPNAAAFIVVAESWVATLKGLPSAMKPLLAFLQHFYLQIPIESSLTWLLTMWKNCDDLQAFWSTSNVEATANLLKALVDSNIAEVAAYHDISPLLTLITQLQDRGSATAANVRTELETRHRDPAR